MDIAEIRLACPGIVLTLEIAADLDTGADKTTQLGALSNYYASAYGDAAFEDCERAIGSLYIAIDRRRLLRRIDGEAGVLQHLNAAGYGHIGQGTGCAARHDNVALDRAAQGAAAGRISTRDRGARNKRDQRRCTGEHNNFHGNALPKDRFDFLPGELLHGSDALERSLTLKGYLPIAKDITMSQLQYLIAQIHMSGRCNL